MNFKATSLVLIVCFVALEAASTRKSSASKGTNQRRSISGASAFAASSANPSSPSPSSRYGPPPQGNGGYSDAGAPPHGSLSVADFGGNSLQSGYGSAGASAGGYSGNAGSAAGGYGGNVGGATGGYGGAEPGMPYQFDYSVNEYGNNFGHSQSSDGNKVTGRYYVRLPDGRMQTVLFKADAYSGYTADVQYEGQAQYPSPSNAGGYGAGPQDGYSGSGSSGSYGAGFGQGGHGAAGPSSEYGGASGAGGHAAHGGPAGSYGGRSQGDASFGLGNGIGGGSIGQLPLAVNGEDAFTRQPGRY